MDIENYPDEAGAAVAIVAEAMRAAAEAREQALEHGPAALARLVEVAQRDSGQAARVRRFLLALYNGPAWPLDLTELRGLDLELQRDALAVLALDWHGGQEVHQYVTDGDAVFREFWQRERTA